VSNRIAAGYDMDASITIPPTTFSVDLDMTQPQAKLIKYELNNRRQQEEPIVVANWIPYVAIMEWIPTIPSHGIFQIIAKKPIWTMEAQLLPAQLLNVTARVTGNDVSARDIDSLWSLGIDDLLSKEAWQFIINYTPAHEARLSGNFFYARKHENSPHLQINGAQPMIQDLNIHDTFQQRMEKLNRSPAKKMFSASMELKNGAQPKKFEMINMWSQERSAPLKKINHQIVVMKSDSMQKRCMCSEVKLPILPREVPPPQRIRSAVPAMLTSQLYTGPCEPSAHAMTFKMNAEMSPERKQLVLTSSARPIYDMVNMGLHQMRREAPAALEKALDISHRFFYPSFKPSPLQSSPTRIAAIQATRSSRNDLMKLQLQTPRQISSLTDIKVPQMIDTIASAMSQ